MVGGGSCSTTGTMHGSVYAIVYRPVSYFCHRPSAPAFHRIEASLAAADPPMQGRMVHKAGAAEEAELAGRVRSEVQRQSRTLIRTILHHPPAEPQRAGVDAALTHRSDIVLFKFTL